MDWTELDWTVLTVAAAIATAVATSASVCLSTFWRLADRERVEWITFDENSWWRAARQHGSPMDARPSAQFRVSNIGRGPALAMRTAGIGCRVTMHSRSEGSRAPVDVRLVPALGTGESVLVFVLCEPADWDRAKVAVTWTASPRLLRKRRVRLIPLAEIVARPTYRGPSQDSEQPWKDQAMPEPPGPHLPGFPPDHPLPPRQRDLLAWLRLRRVLRRSR